MSLFKTEELWSTKSGVGESFNSSSLCVTNIFTQTNKSDQIISGSLNGILRLYSQTEKVDEGKMSSDGDTNPFSLTNNSNEIDLSIEHNIKSAILQLSAGRFIAERNISLAILCPQKLIFLIIDETAMNFKVMEEFGLQRVAYNFCYGSFGRATDRDFVCVQSTDGTLSFYINGHLSLTSYPSSALIPGPITYLAQDDSVLTVSGTRILEAYRYKTLAVSQHQSQQQQRRATPDWSINIGESALDIRVCGEQQRCLVVVLCSHSLFIINNATGTVAKKRFEARLRLLLGYGEVDDSGSPRLLVVTTAGQLMVLRGTRMLWQAQMVVNGAVNNVALGRFNGVANYVVCSDGEGSVSVMFLGTEPAVGGVSLGAGGGGAGREGGEAEMARLQERMRAVTAVKGASVITRTKESRASLVRVHTDLSSARLSDEDPDSPEYSVDVRLRATSAAVTNVQARIVLRRPLIATETIYHWSSLTNGVDAVWPVRIRLEGAAMAVCSLRVLIYVSYEHGDGMHTCQAALALPLSMVATYVAPVKAAKFRVTVDLVDGGGEAPSMRRLFPDMLPADRDKDGSESADTAMGIQYRGGSGGGPIVTVLLSTAARRYRVQSDHFEALWLVLKDLQARLLSGHKARLSCRDPPPLEPLFLLLEFHLAVRQNLAHLEHLLEDRARQFRAIEKLLLAKARDRSEVSLVSLDSLAENSLRQLVQLAEMVEEQQQHLVVVGNALCCAVSTFGLVLRLALPPATTVAPASNHTASLTMTEALESALACTVRDDPELGLEELYGLVVGHLLRSPGSGTVPLDAGTPGRCPENLDKLKRHLTVLCDRVAQGGHSGTDTDTKEADREDHEDRASPPGFVQSPRVAVAPPRRTKRRGGEEAAA